MSVHFSPPQGWMNDPNGLVYRKPYWHLFYQYNPGALVWGPMHWGHARSLDLVAWEHLPIALSPTEHGAAFSGSAVIDHWNTSGFGEGAMVLIYTLDHELRQEQGIAVGVEDTSFMPYRANPVIAQAEGVKRDSRDPKVFPFDGGWRMVLAVGTSVEMYASTDLVNWSLLDSFLDPELGPGLNAWETPDLFPLRDSESDDTVWILTVGVETGSPTGGPGTVYWLGHFDGSSFVPIDGGYRWVDHGPDFYAAQSWSNTGERVVWTAWLNSWPYARDAPHGTARGVLAAPRELSLQTTDFGLFLRQSFAREIRRSVPSHRVTAGDFAITVPTLLCFDRPVPGYSLSLLLTYPEGEIGITSEHGLLTVSRTESGISGFAFDISREICSNTSAEIEILIDCGTVEVLADDGMLSLSALAPAFKLPNVIRVTGLIPA